MRILVTGTDLADPIADLDLDTEACCSLRFIVNRDPFCDRPAEWACRLGCCGNVKVVCSDHRDITASVLPRIFVCTRCHTTRPSISSTWPI